MELLGLEEKNTAANISAMQPAEGEESDDSEAEADPWEAVVERNVSATVPQRTGKAKVLHEQAQAQTQAQRTQKAKSVEVDGSQDSLMNSRSSRATSSAWADEPEEQEDEDEEEGGYAGTWDTDAVDGLKSAMGDESDDGYGLGMSAADRTAVLKRVTKRD
jgi:hypothetical protein